MKNINEDLKHTPPEVTVESRSFLNRIADFINFSWISFLAIVLAFILPISILILFIFAGDTATKFRAIGLLLLSVSGLSIIALLLGRIGTHVWNTLWQQKQIDKDIQQLHDQLQGEDFFTTLIRINFRYIDKYYLQTQVQADKSFRLSAIAASVSLIMIISGIGMLFFNNADKTIEPAYITMAAGVLGEFIAAVFFYLYNRTISEMSNYHQKLVLTQNISLALKITESLPVTEKSKVQAKLISSLSKDINMYLTMQVAKALGNNKKTAGDFVDKDA